MSSGAPMQCKDVPDAPILRFLAQRPGVWHSWLSHSEKDVDRAMPKDTPPKLVLAKMRTLMRRKLVDGCGCGCRGDFVITELGQAWLVALDTDTMTADTGNGEVHDNRTA